MLVRVAGTKSTAVIFLADIWKPGKQWDSRYLWMPLEIGEGEIHLPPPQPWTLDVKAGVATVLFREKK